MLKTAGIVRCYGLTHWLEKVLKSLDFLDLVLLVNHRFKDVTVRPDNTEEIYNKLNQDNVTLLTGEGMLQHDLFNELQKSLIKYDYVFINDADEFIAGEDRLKMISTLEEKKLDGGTCNITDYENGLTCAYGDRSHKPTVIVKPTVHFHDTRGSKHSNYFFKDITMHHFGYHKDNDLEWKVKNLWYPKTGMERAMCGARKVVPPDWLKEIMED